jgi:hypothetical protein
MKYHHRFEAGIQHASLIMHFLQLLLDALKKQQVSQGGRRFLPPSHAFGNLKLKLYE